MRKDLLAVFGEFQNKKLQDAVLVAAYHKGETIKVMREFGRHVLAVSDSRGVIATLEYSGAEDSMEAFRNAFPLLGTLHLMRSSNILFPDSLNN